MKLGRSFATSTATPKLVASSVNQSTFYQSSCCSKESKCRLPSNSSLLLQRIILLGSLTPYPHINEFPPELTERRAHQICLLTMGLHLQTSLFVGIQSLPTHSPFTPLKTLIIGMRHVIQIHHIEQTFNPPLPALSSNEFVP